MLEELLFCLHLVDRLAFLDSPIPKRRAFMDDLVANVADILWTNFASTTDLSAFAEYFANIYNERQAEYASYGQGPHQLGDSLKNTLLWEYGKRMAEIISPRKSALRVSLIGNLAMSHATGLIPVIRHAANELPWGTLT